MQYYHMKFYHLDFRDGVQPFIIDVPVTTNGRDDKRFHKHLMMNTGYSSIVLETAYEERISEYFQKLIYENSYGMLPTAKYDLLKTAIKVFNKLLKVIPLYLQNKDGGEILNIIKEFISVLNTCIEMLDEKHILTPIFFTWSLKGSVSNNS